MHEEIETHHLTASIFDAINAHLVERGLFLHEGTIVDARLISVPPSTKNKEQALLHGDETDVFGDAGCPGVEKREENLALPVTCHIAMRPSKRKALPKATVDELMEKLEHANSSPISQNRLLSPGCAVH